MENKEKQQKPNFSSESLKGLIEHLPEPCLLTDGMGKLVEANQLACDLVDSEREKLLDMTTDDLVKELGMKPFPQMVASKGEDQQVKKILKVDEEKLTLELKGNSILVDGKERVLFFLRDYYSYSDLKKLSDRLHLPQINPKFLESKPGISQLEKAFEWQEALFEGSRDAIFISNEDANFVAVNQSACELSGYSREELLDMKIPDLHEQSDLEAYNKYHDRIMDGEDVLCQARILKNNGEKVDAELNNSRIFIGEETYLHTTARDISKRKELTNTLKEERDRLRELHSTAHKIHECEDKRDACEIAAGATEDILELESCEIFLREENGLAQAMSSKRSFGKETDDLQLKKRLATRTLEKGEITWGNVDDISDIESEEGKYKSVICIPIGQQGTFISASRERNKYSEQDVNLAKLLAEHLRETLERIELEGKLRERSIRDPLTKLYNRRYFNETLKKEIERSKRRGYTDGFLMIDVNRFKEINDRYSHKTGDEVLQAVAGILKSNVRSADTVVRYGGDEFLIMLIEADSGVDATAGRIKKAVSEWNEESSLIDFPLTLAIGISHWSPSQSRDVEAALKEADEKMYEDKRSGPQESSE